MGSAPLHRAGAGSDVALLVFAVACTGFRVHQHRINESAPRLAPRWVESACLVVRAPAKLGRLHLPPRQANGALGSALLHRAGAGSDVVLLVFAVVACTGFCVHQHRINESAPPPAPRWFESTKRVVRAPAKLGRLRPSPGKRMVPWSLLSFTVLALAPMWCCSCSPSRVLGFACTNTELKRECATACATLV